MFVTRRALLLVPAMAGCGPALLDVRANAEHITNEQAAENDAKQALLAPPPPG
jgi:hypothetical protein